MYRILLTLLLSSSIQATELHEIYFGARPFGMGNAFTAIANDEYSPFTNPAGITRARKNRSRQTMHLFKFPNLTVGSNGGTQFYQDLQSGQQATEELIAQAASDGGKPLWLFAGLYPVGIFELGKQGAVAVGGFVGGRGFISVDPSAPQNTTIESTIDTSGLINVGFSNKTNRLNFGFSIRPIQRWAYEDTIPTTELADTALIQERVQLDSQTLTGLGLDAGVMFTFADFWFPTLGLSVLNLPTGSKENFLNPYSKKSQTIYGNVYTSAVDLGQDSQPLSTIDPTDVRLGFSITPRFNRKIAMRLALDVHHFPLEFGGGYLGYDGIEPIKMVHAGAELFAGNPLEQSDWSVRVGLNQGHYTMGATIKFSLFALEFATFGQDISTDASPDEDRRFLGNLSIEF